MGACNSQDPWYNRGMKEKNTYTTEVVREGLTQYKFSGHGFTLSVGTGKGHYASCGTCELAILDEDGEFVTLTEGDDVAGYKPLGYISQFINVLETRQDAWACRRFFHHYFEPVQIG